MMYGDVALLAKYNLISNAPKRSPLFLLGLLGLTLFSSPAAAQVLDLGPADPTLFDTVIDAPADIDFQLILSGILESLGSGSAAQINIPEGVDLQLLSGILESLSNGSAAQIDLPEGVDFQLILNAIIQSLGTGSPAQIDIPEGIDFQLRSRPVWSTSLTAA